MKSNKIKKIGIISLLAAVTIVSVAGCAKSKKAETVSETTNAKEIVEVAETETMQETTINWEQVESYILQNTKYKRLKLVTKSVNVYNSEKKYDTNLMYGDELITDGTICDNLLKIYFFNNSGNLCCGWVNFEAECQEWYMVVE